MPMLIILSIDIIIKGMSSRSRKGIHRNSFIQKLMALLQDPACQQFVRWTEAENGFNIISVSGFTQTVLPQYFKHQNFSSFVRQLNMYGFNKIRSKDGKEGENIYENPNLKRGNRLSLRKIQRKVVNSSAEKEEQMVLINENRLVVRKNQNELEKVKERQVTLENKYLELIEQNRYLLMQNDKIIKAIRNEQKKRQRLLNEIMTIVSSFQPLAIEAQKNELQPAEPQGPKRQEPKAQLEEAEQKKMSMLDANEEYLSLDDFLNIDGDSASEGFRF